MKKDAGFSAIELVVVIAIAAILASIAIPGFLRWRANAKLAGATTNLKADLEMSKLRAIRENDLVAVLFTGNGYTIFIDNGALSENWSREADETLVKNVQYIPGVSATNITFTNSRFRFNGRGLPEDKVGALISANPGSVSIVGKTGTRQVDVNTLGRIRILW